MRRRSSALLAVLAALAFPSAAAASVDQIYSDFATDGRLNCSYSRSDLQAFLRDATLSEYGDPVVMLGARVAVQGQLSGSCARTGVGSTTPPTGTTVPPPATTSTLPTTEPPGTTGLPGGSTGQVDTGTNTDDGTTVAAAARPGSGGGSSLVATGLAAIGALGLLGFLGLRLRRSARRA